MPGGYGIPTGTTGMLAWNWVEERLVAAHTYWIVTTRPSGRPHAMPVWGVWVDGAFCFGTDRLSCKARNLAVNPAITVHLDSGDEPVILEGTAQELGRGPDLDAVDKAYAEKYKMALTSAPGDLVVFRLSPATAFAWREKDFNRSATRWRFLP